MLLGIVDLSKPDEQPYLPSPFVSAKRHTLDTIKGWLKIGQGAFMLTEQEMVDSEVDQGANLYSGGAMVPSQFYTFLIVLHGMGDITELTVQPPEGIHNTSSIHPITPFLRHSYPFM